MGYLGMVRRQPQFSQVSMIMVFSIALGAIPGSPQLRLLTVLYDLFTSREFIFSICIFVDALVAISKIRFLVRYVCTRYVCMYVWDQFTLPIHDFRHKRIWNKDMQFSDLCLTLGGITTGIQILRHVIIYRISSGLPLGTSNTDTWRLKPSTRCQLLVDRSELCTKFIFNFSQLILEASAQKKKLAST